MGNSKQFNLESDIDFKLLREQKLHLLEILSPPIAVSLDQANAIEGIIHLIDHVQDCAAFDYGTEAVFGDFDDTPDSSLPYFGVDQE